MITHAYQTRQVLRNKAAVKASFVTSTMPQQETSEAASDFLNTILQEAQCFEGRLCKALGASDETTQGD